MKRIGFPGYGLRVLIRITSELAARVLVVAPRA